MPERTAADRRLVLTVTTDEYRCESVAFTHDGSLLAIGKSNGMVGIWDLRTRVPIKHFLHDLRGGAVTAVVFSADDRMLATGGEDGHLKIRDMRTAKVILRRQHPAAIHAVAIDPIAELIATACDDGALRVWTRRGRIQSQIDGGCGPATRAVAFTPDGALATSEQAVTWSADGRFSAVVTPREVQVIGTGGRASTDSPPSRPGT
jgi:WD40 repeat protein